MDGLPVITWYTGLTGVDVSVSLEIYSLRKKNFMNVSWMYGIKLVKGLD